jgi:hypothetical protein
MRAARTEFRTGVSNQQSDALGEKVPGASEHGGTKAAFGMVIDAVSCALERASCQRYDVILDASNASAFDKPAGRTRGGETDGNRQRGRGRSR